MLGSERAVHATQMVRMQDSLGALCDAYAAKEILKVLRKASLAGQALASLDAIEALADETIEQIAPISYENAQEMPH